MKPWQFNQFKETEGLLKQLEEERPLTPREWAITTVIALFLLALLALGGLFVLAQKQNGETHESRGTYKATQKTGVITEGVR